jgi:hypothetical protein
VSKLAFLFLARLSLGLSGSDELLSSRGSGRPFVLVFEFSSSEVSLSTIRILRRELRTGSWSLFWLEFEQSSPSMVVPDAVAVRFLSVDTKLK